MGPHTPDLVIDTRTKDPFTVSPPRDVAIRSVRKHRMTKVPARGLNMVQFPCGSYIHLLATGAYKLVNSNFKFKLVLLTIQSAASKSTILDNATDKLPTSKTLATCIPTLTFQT